MGIPIATNFDAKTSTPLDEFTRFASLTAWWACEFKKVGVPFFVTDEKRLYVLEADGEEPVKIETGSGLSWIVN